MMKKILISSAYGPHILGEKALLLYNIRTLKNMHKKNYWMFGGEFNMIASLVEKKEV